METIFIILSAIVGGFIFSTLLFKVFASKALPNPEEVDIYSKVNLSTSKADFAEVQVAKGKDKERVA
ncbi:hypothetical protein R9C00_25600 [Flammeovirgaceae bacterium SG7u.111]|nr:hypothetical protein [Flammeovirgaceae bacterium SG7u.132]WPO35073.1 hypothetical protein R9C00_25600 [Flammeovirgaceae bacterium SG7u.111]